MTPEVQKDRDHPALASRRVAKNTTYLALADGANKVMLFFFNMVAARHLGVAKFGILSFALAFVTMFAVFTDLGLGAVTAREVARDARAARRLISNSLGVKLLASLAVILLIGALVKILGYPPATARVVYICSFFVVESAITSYYCYVFQGFERMELAALTRAVQTVVLVVGAVLLSRQGAAVESYALLYVGAGLLSVLFAGAAAVVWLMPPELSFAPRLWWQMLRSSWPIGLTVTFTVFYYWNGTSVLSKLSGDEAVGNYSAAFRLALGMAFAGFGFSGAVFPLLSRLFVTSRRRLSQALELSFRYMSLLVLPMAVFGATLALPITSFVYGHGYEGSAAVFRLVSVWAALACLNSLLSNYLISVDKPSTVTVQAAVSLTVNLVANLLLIPRLGAVGAGASIVCAEAIGFAYLLTKLVRTGEGFRGSRYARVLPQIVAATMPAVFLARLFARSNLIVGLSLAAVAYLVALFVTGGVRRQDIVLLFGLVRRGDA